jgi:Protein of unknown function (DUF3128)
MAQPPPSSSTTGSSSSKGAGIEESKDAHTTNAFPSSSAHHGAAAARQTTEFIGLGLFWDEWARCIGSRYQIDHLYRVGKLDSCSKQWKDLKIATRARLKHRWDPQAAQQLLNSTYYKKRTTISPTAGAIWELKDKPGWD